MPDDVAHRQMEQIEKDGKKYIHFAWAGQRKGVNPTTTAYTDPVF